MTNAAIIISVSDYSGRFASLPGCKNDASAIKVLLEKTGKFDERLIMDGSEPSSVVKDKLADFVKSLQNSNIEELFFYYTGHGLFEDNEFFFLLSDFDAARRNSSSLSNSELDGLVRSLNPQIFIKIVDACQSGVSYVKGDNELEEYVKQHQSGFKKLYFLFSSSADQSSYATPKISRFTEGIIESITAHKSDRIRYQDLMSSVADRFQNNPRQTPFFVAQADYTEIFCHVTQDLKSALSGLLDDKGATDPQPPQENVDLVAQVRAKAAAFATEADAHATLDRLADFLIDVELLGELRELYSKEVFFHEEYPARRRPIGEWLAEKLNEDVIFAKVSKKSEPYQKKVPRPIPDLAALTSGRLEDYQYQTVTEYRNVISGYTLSAKLPYHYLSFELEPKEPSISPEYLLFVPLVSRTTLYLFSSHERYVYSGWEETRLAGASEWRLSTLPIKDVNKIAAEVGAIVQAFQEDVLERLREQFQGTAPPPPEKKETEPKKGKQG